MSVEKRLIFTSATALEYIYANYTVFAYTPRRVVFRKYHGHTMHIRHFIAFKECLIIQAMYGYILNMESNYYNTN